MVNRDVTVSDQESMMFSGTCPDLWLSTFKVETKFSEDSENCIKTSSTFTDKLWRGKRWPTETQVLREAFTAVG